MSAKGNDFSHTVDPDLGGVETMGQTMDGADLTRQADAAKKKSAAKTKAILGVAGLLAVLGIGKFGLDSYMATPAAPPPTMVKTTQPLPPQSAPQVNTQDAAIQIQMAPQATQSSAPVITPPTVAAPAVTFVTQPAAPSIGLGLPTGAPQGVSTQGAVAITGLGSASPMPAVAASAPEVKPNTQATPVSGADQAQYVKQDAFNGIVGRVEVLENEITGLKMLEGRIKKVEESGTSTLVKPSRQSSAKPANSNSAGASSASSQTRHVGPRESKKDIKTSGGEVRPGFWVDEDSKADKAVKKSSEAMTESTKEISPAKATGKKDKAEEETVFGNRRAAAFPYQLIAIVQDRAWFKLDDGSMVTVQNNEVLPNGVRVLKIDANKDEVKTSAGTIR